MMPSIKSLLNSKILKLGLVGVALLLIPRRSSLRQQDEHLPQDDKRHQHDLEYKSTHSKDD